LLKLHIMDLQLSKNYCYIMGLNLNQKINIKGQREQILYFMHDCKKRVTKSNKNFFRTYKK